MNGLRVGDGLTLPLDFMTLATVVYGARGSGKTTFGRVLAEEAHRAKQRVCAIDLKGDWYGLKSTADGTGPGIPVVVFGGDHADLPLEEGAGTFVAETVAGLEQSCILDLEYFSKGKQVTFLTDFFLRLYDSNREPLLLLADEAQRYAPQKPNDPQQSRCLGAVEDVVKLGRKHGIGVVLFTQRGSSLNKECSELCDTLVAFRTPGVLDQGRIKDWLEANATKDQRDYIMGTISGLPTGTAMFASDHPELKLFQVTAVKRPWTFDSSATPKVGQRPVEPKVLAESDIEALKQKMADAIERAKADDPKELRKQIVELQHELKRAHELSTLATPEPVVEQVEVEVPVPFLDDATRTELKAQMAEVGVLIQTTVGEYVDGLQRNLMQVIPERLESVIEARVRRLSNEVRLTVEGARTPPPTRAQPLPKASATDGAHTAIPSRSAPPSTGRLNAKDVSAPKKILNALAIYDELTQSRLAALTGVKRKTSTMRNALSALRGAGFVHGSDPVRITDLGRAEVGDIPTLPSGAELVQQWRDELGDGAPGRLFNALLDAYPAVLSADELAERADVEPGTSTLRNGMSRLRVLGLVNGMQLDSDIAEALR